MAGTSREAAGAKNSGPSDQPMDWQVVEARKKKGRGEKKTREKQKGTEPTRQNPLCQSLAPTPSLLGLKQGPLTPRLSDS